MRWTAPFLSGLMALAFSMPAQAQTPGAKTVDDAWVVAAKAGLSGHLTIGDGARIAAAAGVMRDIPPGGQVGGIPAMPLKQWHRQTVALARLAKGKGTVDDQ